MQFIRNDGSHEKPLKWLRKSWLKILLILVLLALLGQMLFYTFFLPIGAKIKVTTHDEADEKEDYYLEIVSDCYTFFGAAYFVLGVIALVAFIVHLFMRKWKYVCLATIVTILCYLGVFFSCKIIFELGEHIF